jgi:hypothetical protein
MTTGLPRRALLHGIRLVTGVFGPRYTYHEQFSVKETKIIETQKL